MLKKQMEMEKRERGGHKDVLKDHCDAMLKTKEEERKHERLMSDLSREEYNKLAEEYADKEIRTEKRYRKFFEEYDKMMQERQKIHVSQVASPEYSKNKQFQEWVQRNEKLYAQKIKEKERMLKEWRESVQSFHYNLEYSQHLQLRP